MWSQMWSVKIPSHCGSQFKTMNAIINKLTHIYNLYCFEDPQHINNASNT